MKHLIRLTDNAAWLILTDTWFLAVSVVEGLDCPLQVQKKSLAMSRNENLKTVAFLLNVQHFKR